MSRPKLWNGTAWVDPSFWTGSQWKSYIPPEYDVPIHNHQFSSNGEGFTAWGTTATAGYSSGRLWGKSSGAFLTSIGLQKATTGLEVWGLAGHSVRHRFRARGVNEGTGGPGYYSGTITYAHWVWTQWPGDRLELVVPGASATGPLAMPFDSAYRTYTSVTGVLPQYPRTPSGQSVLSFSVYTGPLGEASSAWKPRVDIDWWVVDDLTTGTVLMTLGDPGWEPFVRTASGSWI